jgi:hypothetical protein
VTQWLLKSYRIHSGKAASVGQYTHDIDCRHRTERCIFFEREACFPIKHRLALCYFPLLAAMCSSFATAMIVGFSSGGAAS